MDELDSTLVVSTTVSEYMNTHPETTQAQELSHAIAALSKEDQMVVEKTLNGVVGKMDQKERKEYLERWDGCRHRESTAVSFRINVVDQETRYVVASAHQAPYALQKFIGDKSVYVLDWYPKEHLTVITTDIVTDIHPVLQRLSPWQVFPFGDIQEAIVNRIHKEIHSFDELQTADISALFGIAVKNPSLKTIHEWIEMSPIALVCGDSISLVIERLPFVSAL